MKFRMHTTNRFTVAGLLLAVLCMHALSTRAQEAPLRQVGHQQEDGQLTVSFGYRDVFTPRVQEKLKSGLPTRLVIQLVIENEKGRQVSFWARTVHIVYDLWEEHFVITVKDPGGKRATRLKTIRDVMKTAGAIWHTPVARNLPPGKYRIKAVIEANPVSEKMVRNIQRWISRPSGGFRDAGSGSYFGSFVGYFVDRNIARAEKTIRFISQWLEP